MPNLNVVSTLDHRGVLSQAESFPTEFIVCCGFGNRCRGVQLVSVLLGQSHKNFLLGDGCVWVVPVVVRCRSF